ncbi:MAG: 2-phospho-L-lactate transferase [Bifidobacteriaceae bacterium]|jgi:LPPG:FO 2-phospho-L-lactate transferase|nr:2-phospho-L-lactate transferase [Bifidobacteriaceae bacterium]
MKLTVLSGGVGGARFTRGLLALLAQRLPDGAGGTTAQVTVIANTGDDLWLHGVRVCPDLDTLMYTLGGAVEESQGWGRRDESRRVSDDLAHYGLGWEWFTLGDLDLATHLARTELLRQGLTLSAATVHLAQRWHLPVRLLPMSDDAVETHVETADGQLVHFEEWWVRWRASLPARRFVQVGLNGASPAPGVLEAIAEADVLVVPPSNAVVSVGTILAIPGVREVVAATGAPVVGVSPIIAGAPVRGMLDTCLATIGVAAEAAAVARHYGRRAQGGVLDAWLLDTADADAVPGLAGEGWLVAAAPTLMTDVPAAAGVAEAVLRLVDRLP